MKCGSAWLGELEDLAMPLIDRYNAQVVCDTKGPWTAWLQPPGR